MQIEVVGSLSGLDRFAEDWDLLAEASAHRSPLLGHAWLTVLLGRLQEDGSWAVLVAHEGGRVCGVLPLVLASLDGTRGHVQLVQPPSNSQTISVDAVIRNGCESCVPLLIEAAFEHWPGALALRLRRVDAVSPFASWILKGLPGRTLSGTAGRGASVAVPASFDEYLQRLSKSQQTHLRRSQKRLAELPNSRFEYLDQFSQDAFDAILTSEHSGWKGEKGTSVLSSLETTRFYRDLASRVDAKGWLRLQRLCVGGETLAGNLSFQVGDSLLLWKLGYSAAHSKLAPGGLLLADIIRRACEDQSSRRIDLMTEEDWYDKWGMAWRPFLDVIVFRNTLAGRGLRLALMARRKVRALAAAASTAGATRQSGNASVDTP